MLIVVPRILGRSCGLNDHAQVIAAALPDGVQQAQILTLQQAGSIRSDQPVLLEFTPLAYSPIGLPIRLLLQVLRWRQQGRAVVVYFHELPFAGNSGLKALLAVRLQRLYCQLLAMSSTRIIVNQTSGETLFRRVPAERSPVFLPSCSNIGEAQAPPSYRQRPLRVAIFGSAGKRRHAHAVVASLGGYRALFGEAVEVIDIGDDLHLPPIVRPEVRCLGPLSAAAVLEQLLRCRFGFFYSEPEQFSKSGVFAAYCASGVVPVIAQAGKPASPHSAPAVSTLFLTPEDVLAGISLDATAETVWRHSRQWHERYSVEVAARTIHSLLEC